MIKKGGEQISPFEVEEFLMHHPLVKLAICFSVPSKLYGEEVGCALVISKTSKLDRISTKKFIPQLRAFFKNQTDSSINQLAQFKWPTHWKIVHDEELPKTKTKKYIRVGRCYHTFLIAYESFFANFFRLGRQAGHWA